MAEAHEPLFHAISSVRGQIHGQKTECFTPETPVRTLDVVKGSRLFSCDDYIMVSFKIKEAARPGVMGVCRLKRRKPMKMSELSLLRDRRLHPVLMNAATGKPLRLRPFSVPRYHLL